METNSNKNAMNEKKQRSKAAKIVLWVILGCFVATLLVLGTMLIIAACGGTGTSNGGILGLPWDACTTVLGFFAVALVLAWLLTEPSFKKEEEVFEANDIYQTYVKKVSTPRPVVKKEDNKANSGKPATQENESANSAAESEDEGAKKKSEPLSEETEFSADDTNESESCESAADVAEPEAESEENEPEEDTLKDASEDIFAEEETNEDDEADDDEDEIDDDSEDDDDVELPDENSAAGLFIGAFIGDDGEMYRYRRSFMSRIIQASDNTKSYYTAVKNKLLSYKNVRSRTSWGYEAFNLGRKKLVRLNIRGKTLVMYIALDPADYVGSKYHIRDMSDKSKYASIPVMVRIKSPRGARFAVELIEQLAEKCQFKKDAKYSEQSFELEMRDNDALIEEGLIKVVPVAKVKNVDGVKENVNV